MIAYVRKANTSRDAEGTGAGGQKCRFADTEAASRHENATGAVVRRVGKIDIRIVSDCVAHGAK